MDLEQKLVPIYKTIVSLPSDPSLNLKYDTSCDAVGYQNSNILNPKTPKTPIHSAMRDGSRQLLLL